MMCARCRHEIPDEANYCSFCGASQRPPASMPLSARRLTRAPGEGKIAGVCAGLANYFDVDVTLVRALWLIFSIVPGAVVGGIVAYVLAWLVMPEGHGTADPYRHNRLVRFATDRKIAGVCGGLADYFGVDSTPVRVLWRRRIPRTSRRARSNRPRSRHRNRRRSRPARSRGGGGRPRCRRPPV